MSAVAEAAVNGVIAGMMWWGLDSVFGPVGGPDPILYGCGVAFGFFVGRVPSRETP